MGASATRAGLIRFPPPRAKKSSRARFRLCHLCFSRHRFFPFKTDEFLPFIRGSLEQLGIRLAPYPIVPDSYHSDQSELDKLDQHAAPSRCVPRVHPIWTQSDLSIVALYGLEVPCGDILVPAVPDFPATVSRRFSSFGWCLLISPSPKYHLLISCLTTQSLTSRDE